MLRAGELRSGQTDRKSMHLRSHATKAIVLDIDGTLAREDHAVSDAGYRALAALESAGLRTILLTGRSESAALTVATPIKYAPDMEYSELELFQDSQFLSTSLLAVGAGCSRMCRA